MPSLTRGGDGRWLSRKAIPSGVRPHYVSLAGKRAVHEERFRLDADVPVERARAELIEWNAAVERRIAATKDASEAAPREPMRLTHRDLHAAVGSWYCWFVRHSRERRARLLEPGSSPHVWPLTTPGSLQNSKGDVVDDPSCCRCAGAGDGRRTCRRATCCRGSDAARAPDAWGRSPRRASSVPLLSALEPGVPLPLGLRLALPAVHEAARLLRPPHNTLRCSLVSRREAGGPKTSVTPHRGRPLATPSAANGWGQFPWPQLAVVAHPRAAEEWRPEWTPCVAPDAGRGGRLGSCGVFASGIKHLLRS